MKIYTKTGDDGSTGLFGGGRVPKEHPRVEAYGTLDELNSVLGVARAQLRVPVAPSDAISGEAAQKLTDIADYIEIVQNDLFDMGAQFAASRPPKITVTAESVAQLERWIDMAESVLPPLTNFILPGGSLAAATLHVARTVCRRAERRGWEMVRQGEGENATGPEALSIPLIYLNRLSDLCFVWARLANFCTGTDDVKWKPTERK